MDRTPARHAGTPDAIAAATSAAEIPPPASLPELDAIAVPAVLVDDSGVVVGANAAAAEAIGHDLLVRPVSSWPGARPIVGEDRRVLGAGDLPFGPGALGGTDPGTGRPSERLVCIPTADGQDQWYSVWVMPWPGRTSPDSTATGDPSPGVPAPGPLALTQLFPGDARRRITQAGRERVVDLDRKYGRQAALARAGMAVNQPRELPTLLGTLLDRLRSDLPADAAAIAFGLDAATAANGTPEHERGVFASDAGFTGPAERQAAEALHAGGAGQWVSQAGRPLTVDRPETDPYRRDPDSPIRSWAAIPLSDGGDVFGVLYAFDRTPRRYDADDLLFLRELARRAGAAIAKVGFIDRLERQRGELELHRDHLEELVADRTTELEASHARLRTADRLAAIGTFTAGLGHDMNNVLFPLRCRLDAMEKQSSIDVKEAADTIGATRRAVSFLQSLSDGLRLFARDPLAGDLDASTHLEPWWTSVAPLLRHSLPTEVIVEADLPADLPPVNVAAAGLTQVVLNLMVNAADVMPDGGTVRIHARQPDDPIAREDTVILEVADNGPGMTPDVAAQVFDPFFSTKTRTVSTGLGLWLVHQVVDRAGGAVELDTAPGRGTRFELHLPMAETAGSLRGSAITARGVGHPPGAESVSEPGDHSEARDSSGAGGSAGSSRGTGSTRSSAPSPLAVAIESPDPRRAAWIGRAVEDAGARIAGPQDEGEAGPEVVILVAGPDDGTVDAAALRIADARTRAPAARFLLVGTWPEPVATDPASNAAGDPEWVDDPDDLPSIREHLQRIIDGRPNDRPAQEGP